MSLRGYSTVWRDSDDKIIKQVVNDRASRFQHVFDAEREELQGLEKGWIYDLHAVENTKKIIITRRRKISAISAS